MTVTTVRLTAAHRDRNPANCDPDNLFAACVYRHSNYDWGANSITAKRIHAKRRAEGMELLFTDEDIGLAE